ncbi:hypothetical protein PW52_01955 [Tamlana sedimentorum]|uniref:Right handed beta helix domain-containing protein n=1 Tax=Neotamlana sedimentorum TaxID=1435349 RepID=A0A0D7WDK9_9FLAO|nr:right-handed parallel beta-helix repeat-containing protein [Tamlana sedimentorum]KJD37221.1 hypothetical protein PW52_01955 [Tamlana sedimentorum]
MKMIKNILSIIVLSSAFLSAQTTYFVDDVIGDDVNNGIQKNTPFKSITRINQLILKPGDSVLFRRGGKWVGNLSPKGSGSKNKHIVLGAYGNGAAPVLNANGIISEGENTSYTIKLFNQEYIEIRDLQIRNFNSHESPRKLVLKYNDAYVNTPKMGIYIQGEDCGTLNDIYLTNLEICFVNGDMSTKNNGGVFVEITWNKEVSKRVKSNFNGLYTEGCYIHDVDRTGWSNRSVWDRRSLHSTWGETLANGEKHNWYPSENIFFRNNKFEKAGANALIVRVAKAPLIEYNLFTHNGIKGSGNASFPFNCDGARFQYNEACYTYYNTADDSWDGKKDVDAGGFDSDWNCKNTVIQYNYSHHNGHGGVLICCNGANKTSFNDGTLIRYNVFENNSHHIIRNSGTTTNTQIYNNTFFAGKEQDSVQLVYHKNWNGYPKNTFYANNIFYSLGEGNHFEFTKSKDFTFIANTYFGDIKYSPSDSKKQIGNPLFKNAMPSRLHWKSYLRFLLKKHSPEINTGIWLENHVKEDFLGSPIHGKPDRGAFESDFAN